ncbi:hypothetical protein ACFXA2_01665 [Micromonospora chalcea]
MTVKPNRPASTVHPALPWHVAATASIAAALAVGGMLTAAPAAAAPADTTQAAMAACWYATYAPNKEGSVVRGWGEKWDCGGSTRWTITLQRLRGPGWWQNEGVNTHTGDNWVSVAGGCVTGTYRTILQSNAGHQMVSSHGYITC